MEIYVPYRVSNLPFIQMAVDLLDEFNETYNSEEEVEDYYEIDPIRNFISLFYSENENMTQADKDAVVDYISQNFYIIKGTTKVCELLLKYKFLSGEGTEIVYTGKILRVKLSGNGEYSYLYGTDVFLNRFKEFLNTLLYFENCEIVVENKEVVIRYNRDQGNIAYDVDMYYIASSDTPIDPEQSDDPEPGE